MHGLLRLAARPGDPATRGGRRKKVSAGARVLLGRPDLAGRSCDDCRRWLYDGRGRRVERGGKPVERGELALRLLTTKSCLRCPRLPLEAWDGEDWYLWSLWCQCKRWNALPAAGGVEDQDPVTMSVFSLFDEAYGEYLECLRQR